MHTLPKLEYEYNALEPHIDAKTMEIHHSKHHQAYVDKLNGAVNGTKFEDMDVNEILKNLDKVPEDIRTAVRNNGGGHANHSFFWQVIGPNGGEDTGKIGDAINEQFGSFDKYLWGFVNNKVIDNGVKAMSEIPANTKLSDELSKDLKKRGFNFVGSTICYAFMQAIGMVNDHEVSCFRYKEV